jgi:hypothetical protein
MRQVSLLKKISRVFKQKSGKDKRLNFRFDVSYVEDLELEINNSKYKLKEISLEGLSFFTSKDLSNSFEPETLLDCSIVFKGSKLNLQLKTVSIVDQLIGCKITTNKDNYHNFVKNDLSLFLVSYLN